MPLDPSIILQSTNVASEYQKALGAIQAQQAQQQQLEAQTLQLAQQKQALRDEALFRKAYIAAQGNPERTVAIAQALRVGPEKIGAFQAQIAKQALEQATLNKTNSETDKNNVEVQDKHNDEILGEIQPALDAAPDKFDAVRSQVVQNALDKHLITPDTAQKALSGSQEDFKVLAATFRNATVQAAQARAKAAAQTADAATQNADTNSAKQIDAHKKAILEETEKTKVDSANSLSNALTSGGLARYASVYAALTPDQKLNFASPEDIIKQGIQPAQLKQQLDNAAMTADERSKRDQAELAQTEKAKHDAALEKDSAGRLAVEQGNLALNRTKTAASLLKDGLDANGKPIPGAAGEMLKSSVQNTSDGRVYLDQDVSFKGLPKGDQAQLKQAANAAGVPLLSSKEVGAVKDVDAAKQAVNNVFETFAANSSDHNGIIASTGRYIGNKATTLTGNNPALDAANKNFLSTIEALKSAGGAGSGLRITGKEIDQMYQMKPQLGDSQATLKAKQSQIVKLMDDKLNGALHRVPVTSGPSANAKVASMEQLAAFAKSKGVSIQAAKKAAEDDGYKVQ